MELPVPYGVYYQNAYLQGAALLEGEGALQVWRHGEAVVPLVVRQLPLNVGQGFDAISPYDFSGPLLGGERADGVWAALREWALDRGIVTAFLRFHPFVGEAERWRDLEGLEVVRAAENIVVDLSDGEALLAGFKSTVPRDLKVARRAGVTCTLHPLDSKRLDGFCSLYLETMDRVGADEYYRFPHAFFEHLAEHLRDRFLVATACADGRLLASCLLLLDGTTAYYYLSGFHYPARAACPNNALVYEAARHLQETGYRRFHLGGGSASVRAFKERFGPQRVPYFVARAVFDAKRYEVLSGGRRNGFFPGYRAPQAVDEAITPTA